MKKALKENSSNIKMMNVPPVNLDMNRIDLEGSSNYRTEYREDEMKELIDSIRENGLLQPIGVMHKKDSSDRFEIVFGFRRFLACKALGLQKISCRLFDPAGTSDVRLLQIAENALRSDPKPEDYRAAFEALRKEGWKYGAIATATGLSEDKVKKLANYAKIFEVFPGASSHLPEITPGHTDALRGKKPEEIKDIFNEVSEIKKENPGKNISVREFKSIASKVKTSKESKPQIITQELIDSVRMAEIRKDSPASDMLFQPTPYSVYMSMLLKWTYIQEQSEKLKEEIDALTERKRLLSNDSLSGMEQLCDFVESMKKIKVRCVDPKIIGCTEELPWTPVYTVTDKTEKFLMKAYFKTKNEMYSTALFKTVMTELTRAHLTEEAFLENMNPNQKFLMSKTDRLGKVMEDFGWRICIIEQSENKTKIKEAG